MLGFILLLVISTAQAGAAPAAQELTVKGAGSCGTLVFTPTAVEFRAAEAQKARTWYYQDLKQIRIDSPRKIVLDTFIDRSRWRFGADRSETFEVTAGEVTGETVAFLLAHVAHPVRTSVVPANLGEASTRVPVKRRRFGKGSHGTLELYATGLAYAAEPRTDSRFWRFADLQSVIRTSPFELLVTACEGGSLRPYAFDVKMPIPQDALDTLWARVNPTLSRIGGAQ